VESKMKFPYIMKKRTIVVGGHDTFVNVMKKRFPNVRFVSTNKRLVSPKIIRQADVILIQNNCVSHSYFNHVVKIASTYKIPVKYFTAAGTTRASQQLIQEDHE